jgi:hypothetical protein
MSLRNCEFDGSGYCENNALLKDVKEVFRYCLHFLSYLEKSQNRPCLKNHSAVVSFMQTGVVKTILHSNESTNQMQELITGLLYVV